MNKKLILGMLLIAGSAIEAKFHQDTKQFYIELKILQKSPGYIKSF